MTLLTEFRRAITEGNGLRWRAAEIAYEYGVGTHAKDAARELAEAGHVSISTVENLARAQKLFLMMGKEIAKHWDEAKRNEDEDRVKAEEDKLARLNACRERLSYVFFHHAAGWVMAKAPTVEDVLEALESAGEQGSFSALMRDLSIPDGVNTWEYKLPKFQKTVESFSNVHDLPEEYRKVIQSFLVTLRGWYENKL